MDAIDFTIINFLNQYSRNSWIFDKFMVFLTNNTLLKGGILVSLLWWAWFYQNDTKDQNRKKVISILTVSFFSIVLARFLAFILPFRYRPLNNMEINFTIPYGMEKTILEGWSSFPSDHAALFFTISIGLYFISKKVGIFAFVYASVFIAFPRIYVGYHYLMDIIVGGFIGFFFAFLGIKYFTNHKLINIIFDFSKSKPSIFYPIIFLITFQIADIFDGVRSITNGAEIIIDFFY